MPLPKDCITLMPEFADRFLSAERIQTMAGMMGPFLITRMVSAAPTIIDLGKLYERYGLTRLVMGRRKDCDLRFADSNISGHHARVLRDAERGWLIEDLGSTNGTFAGERQLQPGQPEPLEEERIDSLAEVVELELWSSKRFHNELDQRARNPRETRRLSNRRYARLRTTTRRKVQNLTGQALDLWGFARRVHGMSVADFVRMFPSPMLVLLSISEARAIDSADLTIGAGDLVEQAGMQGLRFWPITSRDDNTEVIFGRGSNCDMILAHQTISKAHALFGFDEFLGEWTLEDLNSRNGVIIDGERLAAPFKLRDELCIRFGNEVLTQFFKPTAFHNFVKIYGLTNQLT